MLVICMLISKYRELAPKKSVTLLLVFQNQNRGAMSCRRIKWMAKVLTMVKSSNVSNLNKAVGVSR